MRSALINNIQTELASNPTSYLLTGDLGFGIFDGFSQKYPKQFFNCGIAEQNMTSVACGLAHEGATVFTYSIGNFSTLRCLEQIRNDVCYHNSNVTVITVGAGFSYGQLGVSHFATEDIAIMSALPNISIFSPCDTFEVESLFPQFLSLNSPKYFRIDKSSCPGLPLYPLKIGVPRLCHQSSSRIALLATGGIVEEAMLAADVLKSDGLDPTVYSVHTLKPIVAEFIQTLSSSYDFIFTLEEHNSFGGLGSILAHALFSQSSKPIRFKSFCIPDTYPSVVGDQRYLRQYYGLDAPSLVSSIRSFFSL